MLLRGPKTPEPLTLKISPRSTVSGAIRRIALRYGVCLLEHCKASWAFFSVCGISSRHPRFKGFNIWWTPEDPLLQTKLKKLPRLLDLRRKAPARLARSNSLFYTATQWSFVLSGTRLAYWFVIIFHISYKRRWVQMAMTLCSKLCHWYWLRFYHPSKRGILLCEREQVQLLMPNCSKLTYNRHQIHQKQKNHIPFLPLIIHLCLYTLLHSPCLLLIIFIPPSLHHNHPTSPIKTFTSAPWAKGPSSESQILMGFIGLLFRFPYHPLILSPHLFIFIL